MLISCPYCRYDLKVMPQRKKKCPSCSRPIYVKSTPENRSKRIMTEVQAIDAENQWSLYNLRQKSLSTLFPFGLLEQDIEKEIALSAKTDSEAVVSLLTRIIADTTDLHKRKMAWSHLAIYAEAEDRPFYEYLVESIRCELHRYKQRGVKKVEIITAGHGNACLECESHERETFDIDDAIRLMPIPRSTCTRTIAGVRPGFCRCSYVPLAEVNR